MKCICYVLRESALLLVYRRLSQIIIMFFVSTLGSICSTNAWEAKQMSETNNSIKPFHKLGRGVQLETTGKNLPSGQSMIWLQIQRAEHSATLPRCNITKWLIFKRKILILSFLCLFSSVDRSKSFVASVKEEKDFWINCLLEMKAGYEIADGKARERLGYVKLVKVIIERCYSKIIA